MNNFLVLHQTEQHYYMAKNKRMEPALPTLVIEVLPATPDGIQKAITKKLGGYKSKLLAFKDVEKPTCPHELKRICEEKIKERKYQEITIS